MRTAVLAVFAAVATVASFACSDAGDYAGGGYGARRANNSGVPAPGTPEQHDDDDTEGATVADVGNPNADTPPPAPTDPGRAAGELAVKLSTSTPAVDLGKSIDLDVVVEPKNGFSGNVELSVTGLPAGVTPTFTPATVPANGAPVTAKLSLNVPVTATPSAGTASSAIVVSAKSGAIEATANANFKINPRLTLTVPMNIDALRAAGAGTVYRNEWGAEFGANPQPLKTQTGNPIVVQVFNADSKPHVIHGANGFAHGDTGNPIQPNAFELINGQPRLRSLAPGANVNGYPHEGANGPSASFRISVQQAP